MFITINDIIGEKTIYLSYPIRSSKEVAATSMFSEYEMAFKIKIGKWQQKTGIK